jgi:PPOX class probable F420-dependent enzyme
MRLDVVECRSRFASARHAVLAVNGDDGPPLAVPLTFALAGDLILSVVDHKPKASGRLRRLRLLEADPRACVLVEHYDDEWRNLWWVRADVEARVITASALPDEHDRATALLAQRYEQYRDLRPSGAVLELTVRRWTGWAFTSPDLTGSS